MPRKSTAQSKKDNTDGQPTNDLKSMDAETAAETPVEEKKKTRGRVKKSDDETAGGSSTQTPAKGKKAAATKIDTAGEELPEEGSSVPKRRSGRATAKPKEIDPNSKATQVGKQKKTADADSESGEESPPPVKRVKTKAKSDEPAKSPRAKPDPGDRTFIERTPIARYAPNGRRTFKVITWNVTTLRSLVNKNSELLKKLFESEKPDLVCLQEIKLNSEDQEEYEAKLCKLIPGHRFHWNFCTLPDSKSYSGTLAIIKDDSVMAGPSQPTLDGFLTKKPNKTDASKSAAAAAAEGSGGAGRLVGVTLGLPTLRDGDGPVAKEAAAEGRTITAEFEGFFVVAAYVPNSGDKLQRLAFRTEVWDRRMAEHLAGLRARGKPVVYCGDLNVAHLDADIWNVGAKHLAKTAGTTPEERRSFSRLLSGAGAGAGDEPAPPAEAGDLVDAFRWLHPDAHGWFSYWSLRAGNRAVNRGLRLDYFVCSRDLMPPPAAAAAAAAGGGGGGPVVREVAILTDMVALDHAAVVLTMDLP